MTNTTISFEIESMDLKKQIQSYYQKYNKAPNSQYIENLYVLPGVRITLYQSNKIVFQGIDAANEATLWQEKQSLVDVKAAHEATSQTITYPYVGCDETGVGDYLAPLVATACYIDEQHLEAINEMNIRDSKQLTDRYIQEIAPTLKKIVPYATFSLSNAQYNQLVNNNYNAHAIKAFLHNKAIERLFESVPYSSSLPIVMDKFSTPKSYARYLVNIPKVYLPTIFETKAENKYLAVAIASIICRDQFLKIMAEQNKQYGVDFPLGAGSKVDTFARKLIENIGEEEMKTLVKYHFANTDRVFTKKEGL